jgi:ABC-2 type transport system ATP-binding protein
MDVIETSALTRRFGDLTAVDGLNLGVGEGEVFGLLGPNDAGKTTVIKMLTTLLPPTSGQAKVAGFDVQRKAARVRAAIGYVPQLVSVDGTLTGYENLLMSARLYCVPRSERKARIAAGLEFVGLEEAAHRKVAGYSGGMMRRLVGSSLKMSCHSERCEESRSASGRIDEEKIGARFLASLGMTARFCAALHWIYVLQ